MVAAVAVAFAAGGMKMKISSPAFQEGGTIPEKFSKNGQNANPELRIEGAPAEAKSLALIVDDPDAPSGGRKGSLSHGLCPWRDSRIAKRKRPGGAPRRGKKVKPPRPARV